MSEVVTHPESSQAPGPNLGPEAAPPATPRSRIGRRWWIAGIAIAALVVIVFAPLASSDPDGLNRVASDTGFIGQAKNMIGGLLSGYEIPFVSDPALSKVLSGLLGVGIVLLVMLGLGRVLARRRG